MRQACINMKREKKFMGATFSGATAGFNIFILLEQPDISSRLLSTTSSLLNKIKIFLASDIKTHNIDFYYARHLLSLLVFMYVLLNSTA